MMKQNISVCLTFDFDAMSVWIGTFHARSPSAISRGEFGRVGAERLLLMLRDWNISSTWFVPGHTADAFPATVAKVAEHGHEIAHHGYFHEQAKTPGDEARDFDRATAALKRVTGQTPVGYRSPAAETNLVELPFTWGLDDFPAFEFVASRNGVIPGLASPSQMYEIWAGDFDYLHDRLGEGVYILTMHPQCIGRGHRLLMLERLINHMRDRSGVTFKTMSEVALEFKSAHPLKRGT
jgi:peptidoglycan/xylan/chitin deacetylase (PgdA/CDA1 family)